MRVLYSFGFAFYRLLIKIFALSGNEKAKDWIKGRKEIYHTLEGFNPKNKKVVWMHAASLGEFEMGRPLLRKLKENHPNKQFVVTFFSPSGYNALKNDSAFDLALYLPIDTRKETQRFVQKLNPEAVIFMKYEFWPHLMNSIIKAEIPFFIASATFRNGQFLFSKAGRFIENSLKKATGIFVQNQSSLNLLQARGFTNATLTGDGRFDNVIRLAKSEAHFSEVEDFLDGQKAFILGSCWPEDEKLIFPLIMRFPFFKFIFAPHDISKKRIEEIKENLPAKAVLYSELKDTTSLEDIRVLIIDNIGILSRIYRLGYLAFVGGGFKQGLHNILEPLAYGLPTVYGPKTEKFWEGKAADEMGAGKIVTNQEELMMWMNSMRDPITYGESRNKAHRFISENSGATEKMYAQINSHLK